MHDELDLLARRAARAVHERGADVVGDGAVAQVKRRSRRPAMALGLSMVVVVTLASGAVWLSRGRPERVALDRELGQTWTRWQAVDSAALEADGAVDIAAAVVVDGRVVAVGVDAANATNDRVRPGVWLSDDGRTWRPTPTDAIDDGGRRYADAAQIMTDVVVVDEDQLVAVGYANFEPRTEALAWRSNDRGETWQLVQDTVGEGDSAVHAAAVAGPDVVAVGQVDAAAPSGGLPASWRLTDEGWSSAQRTPVRTGALWSVSATGEERVAIGFDAGSGRTTILFSASDGPWRRARSDVGDAVELDVARVRTRPRDGYVAVGTISDDRGDRRRGIVLTSADGVDWIRDGQIVVASEAAGDQQFRDIAFTDHGTVVVGQQDGRATVWVAGSDTRLEPVFRSDETESIVERVLVHDRELIAIGRVTPPGDEQRAAVWTASAP